MATLKAGSGDVDRQIYLSTTTECIFSTFHPSDTIEYNDAILSQGLNMNLATNKGVHDVVEEVLEQEQGFNEIKLDCKGLTALQHSVQQNDVETTERLLRAGAVVSDSLLFLAAREGFAEVVQALARNGADVNTRDGHGQTPLHHAVLQNSAVFTFLTPSRSPKVQNIKEVVRVLLRNGSDVDVKTENGFSPLHYAVQFKYSDVVHILLEHGADFRSLVDYNIKSPKLFRFQQKTRRSLTLGEFNTFPRLTSLLHIATESNDVSSISSLLDAGAAVDAVQYDGRTPLVIAVKSQHKEAVKVLLDYGADIEQKNRYGLTTLHLCCRSGSVEVMSLLLKAGANINATCKKGNLPYHCILELENDTKLSLGFVEDNLYFAPPYHYYNQQYINSAVMKKTLQNQMCMLYLLGLELHQFNKDLVEKTINKYQVSSKEYLIEYTKNCRLVNQVTLYHVITEIRNPIYIRNLSVTHKLDQACISANAKYPGLCGVIKYLSKSAKVRTELMEKGIQWFIYLNAKNNELHRLPPEILEVVFSYLLNEDIQNFVTCVGQLDYHNEGLSQRLEY